MNDWIRVHKKELSELRGHEEKVAQLQDALGRLKTEFVEYQERSRREKENQKKFALEGFLKDILPLLDTLDSTLKSFKDPKVSSGIELVRKELIKVLAVHGVEQIATAGAKFDPKFHEAVETADEKDVEPGTITSELKAGYIYNDRVLRPAMVKVAGKPSSL